jgi:hypothetical protein
MRIAVVGASAVAGLVFASIAVAVGPGGGGPSVGIVQRAAPTPTGGGGLITLAAPAGEHKEQLTVIDPETRTLAVYHIDTSKGEIVLKSVRNIYYDLKMIEFNGTSPLPGEIRALLEQR